MNLDQQIQSLIKEAPQDGKTPKAITVIAPVLKQVAQRLKYEKYFLLQTPDQRWQVTILSQRSQPHVEKSVIYAFARQEDAMKSTQDQQLVVLPLPVISLIFQLLAMETVDSLIFLETPDNLQIGIEIQRQEIQDLVRNQLQANRIRQQKTSLPPDIA